MIYNIYINYTINKDLFCVATEWIRVKLKLSEHHKNVEMHGSNFLRIASQLSLTVSLVMGHNYFICKYHLVKKKKVM